jgi:1,2-diacylglycerol-3-alpha-glucose alpha-1,2-glucosyltransferase
MSVINYIIDENAVRRLTQNKAWLETYIPEVTKRLERQGFDVVFDQKEGFDLMHIHMPLGRAYQRIHKSEKDKDYPIIFHGHATEDSFTIGSAAKYVVKSWLRKIAAHSDLIICPSESAMVYYRALLPDNEIIQLNYGINLDKYSYSDKGRKRFRQQYEIGMDEKVVSCVAGISYRKGFEEFTSIASQNPDMRFVWVGGEYTEHPCMVFFYKVFARMGDVNLNDLPGNMLMTGYNKDITDALSASDIFFFPSRHETQGLALVEAAANARPIVTRDLPVFREWLTHDHDCLMGSNEEEFNIHIRQLADDPALMRRLGSEARVSAEKYHDIDQTSEQLGKIYNEMLRR